MKVWGLLFMEKQIPLNIWKNVEKCWIQRLDLVFENQSIKGIHHSEFTDVVNDLDWVIAELTKYRNAMARHYGHKQKK